MTCCDCALVVAALVECGSMPLIPVGGGYNGGGGYGGGGYGGGGYGNDGGYGGGRGYGGGGKFQSESLLTRHKCGTHSSAD